MAESREASIIRFHDTAANGIVATVFSHVELVARAITATTGPAVQLREHFVHHSNPALTGFLQKLVAGADRQRILAGTLAASLAETLQVLDHGLAKFSVLGGAASLNSADALKTALSLAPVVVHIAGPDYPFTGESVGDEVIAHVAMLAGASGDKAIVTSFYDVVLAWKRGDGRQALLAPPQHAWAVKMPFTSLARIATLLAGDQQIHASALKKNLLTIERIINSDGSTSLQEAGYLVEQTRLYAALEKEVVATRPAVATLLSGLAPQSPPVVPEVPGMPPLPRARTAQPPPKPAAATGPAKPQKISSPRWHVIIGGEESGPLTDAQLRELARSGRLSRRDPIWREGLADWVPAERVKGLFS